MSALGSFLSAFLNFLARLFKPSPPPVSLPPESGMLETLQPRAYVIVYNPVVDQSTGMKLIETMGWNDPAQLMAGYIADIEACSGGLVKYQIVGSVEANEFPIKLDGFQFQPQQYIDGYRNNTLDQGMVDYEAIIARFDLLQRVAANEFDEVWLFNFPGAGFWESTMAGRGAFFCNSNPVPHTEACPRRFVLMGFSPERGVGEMLEDLGHRAESILAHIFGSEAFLSWAYNRQRNPKTVSSVPRNLFERFLYFDQIAPGQANVGTLHYAPNSQSDYEWGSLRPVQSCCDDWLHFPNMAEPPNFRTVDARDWGSGDIRLHHRWWLTRLPKAAGATNGIANNWWKYVIWVDSPFFD